MNRVRAVKSLHVQYFAAIREATGLREETLESSAATAEDLYVEVAALHGLPFDRSLLRVARNDRMVPWSAPLRDGDTVVFLTPFAGG